MITGGTRVAAVIGHPVAHSLSPAIHNAGFAASGADWVYTAFAVAPGDAVRALDAMRTLGLGGLSVTMPHKEAVAAAVDVCAPAARALDSVNTVVRLPDGRLEGHSTDGDGFVASLHDVGCPVDGRFVVVLGAGAAARSVVDALARAGAASIVVVNRSAERAHHAARLGGAAGRVGSVADVADSDIVVNATSIGMGTTGALDESEGDDMPLSADHLRAGQVVVDLVYHPIDTPLLRAARRLGATAVDGLGMLVHQAALQQQLWLGALPDVAVMRAAAIAELDRRSGGTAPLSVA